MSTERKAIIGATASGMGAAMPVQPLMCRTPYLAARTDEIQPGTPPTENPTENKEKTTMSTAKKTDFEKTANDAAAFGKEQMEAYAKVTSAMAKGSEELLKACITLSQEAAEKNAAAVKALMACKTLNELTETQGKLVQEGVEGMISSMTKLSELGVKIASESLEPINAQYSKAMKKAGESMAA